jgi:hypothetical protein
MNIKFKTFNPFTAQDYYHGKYNVSATTSLNNWLKENPNIEIINWQTCAVGTTRELYITIQYRELGD